MPPRAAAAAPDALAGLAGLDVTGCGDDELLTSARALEQAQRSLDAARMRVAGELEVRGVTDAEGGLRTAGWLARQACLPAAAARRVVRVGAKLRQMPNVEAALVDGRIGLDHARVLADAANPRIVGLLDAVAPLLIDEVERSRFEVWARDVAWVAGQLDVDGGHDAADDEPADRLHVRWVGDELAINGRFHGADAQRVKQVLDAVTDAAQLRAVRDREATPDLPVPARSELAAQAFVDLLRAGLSAGSSGPTTDVTLVFFADRPDAGLAPDGSVLPLRRAEVLLCDPAATGIVLDDAGVPLDMGRTRRLATPEQRRALAVRDGGCVFPGCDAPVGWCDAHHVRWWDADDGPTDLDNLALLCRHHHGVAHRNGWTMAATDDQWFTWCTPGGHVIESQRHGRRRAGPAPPRAA